MKDFKNKKITVIGMGVEGLSSAQFLKEKGAGVTVLDRKQGKGYLEDLDQYDIVVRSPGVRLNLPEIVEAKAKGVEITSQTKLFFDLCPCPVIGVTGTKGKGTTSSLIYEMCKKQGIDTYLGGNIGRPPFEFLDKLSVQSRVVLELSSFQLQDFDKSPHIAVVLMITQEHLRDFNNQNYHESVEEYIEAKRNILRYQKPEDFAVINRDYLASNESDIHTEAKVYRVSRERETEEGCFVKDNKVVLRIMNNELGIRDKEVEIISTKDILLPGKHNYENVCAAVMAATLSGVEKKNIVKVLKTFKGLEHRLELIREVDDVRYYDDSFSTTPETAIAAIEAFEAPEILILGGSGKGSDFTELGRIISTTQNIKAIIGIGVEWPKIKEKILASNAEIIESCKNMVEIVQAAREIADSGDVVLLSPACASFDMFKNYKDRGEQFKKEVSLL